MNHLPIEANALHHRAIATHLQSERIANRGVDGGRFLRRLWEGA